jgi:hypothetical protein
MVALRVRKPEEAFFQEGVLPVPQAEAEADLLFVVTDPGHAVLVPAVCP